MKVDLAVFRESFIEEATEHLAAMERGLLLLETAPNDLECLNGVFRAAHSIKGAAGSLGFERVAEFTHTLETMLDSMRQGKLPVSQQRTTLLLRAADILRDLLRGSDSDANVAESAQTMRKLLENQSKAQVASSMSPSAAATGSLRRLRVTLVPQRTFFSTGIDPLLVVRDLANLGEIEGTAADMSQIPMLEQLVAEHCYLAWTIILRTNATDKQLHEVFLFVEDDCKVTFTEDDAAPVERRGTALTAPSDTERFRRATSGSTLKVPTSKVDALIDLVGEIVIAQSIVKQLAASMAKGQWSALQDAVTALELNTLDLQERVMAIRMVPMDLVFARFPRLVRDLAATLGKDAVLEVSGQDTELDKGLVERLTDPLTHLLRNALDHGLESPAERRATGKPERGTICLSARHSAGGVVIEMTDDGRGLDTQRIRAKAEATGLVQQSDALTDDQVHALIFEPGFSTSEAVSDISGRGVGMDVVKRTIDALNGTLHVETSPGRGTTFRIKLPLTLAIMDGLLLRVGTERFIVPLLSVTESLSPTHKEYKRVAGRGETILVRGAVLPLIRLSQIFRIANAVADPTQAIVVVVETDTGQVGLLVDALLGQSQVVLKSLESHYRRIDGILGATILGDGHVSLIIDIPALCRLAGRSRTQGGRANAA